MKILNPNSLRHLVVSGLLGAIGFTSIVNATTTVEEALSEGGWTVEQSQWLGRIVAVLEPDQGKRQALMEQIVFLNPQAFINADPNRMLAGATLKLPDRSVANLAPSKTVVPIQADVVKEVVTEVEQIGRITSVRGQLTATGKAGVVRALRRRSYVRQGDTLSTGKQGGAQVKFNDGAQIALRRDSTLRIDEYRWQGEEDGAEKAVMSLVKGGFRTITGAIGKLNKSNYRVNSPYATIGIRGTHYALMSCVGGSCAGVSGGKAPKDGLYGGTAFGAIIVDDKHVIEPQQYFHHDGSSFSELMGPPAFLFGADTQVGDASAQQEGGPATASEKGNGSSEGQSDGAGFAAHGGTEAGHIIARVQGGLPGQEGDGVFTEGADRTVDETIENSASSSFNVSTFDLLGDLSNLSSDITALLAGLGATNVQLVDSAASNGFAYVAQVFPFEGLFEASDGIVDNFAGDDFFVTGDFGGKTNLLLSGLETDSGDIGFFFGPTGSAIATQTVSDPAFIAHIGRWDANIVSRFFEPGDGAGVDFPLATEFGYSTDRTPDAQLANLSGLGSSVNFSSVHGFGSDELGQGFVIGAADIQFDVDFISMQITQVFFNVNDNQSRNWFFNGSGLGVSLENDFFVGLSGTCSSCASGSSAEAHFNTTFLGGQAEGALGSFRAQTGTFSVDAQEAIAGIVVYKR